jgi:hypothetical protein
MSGDLQLTDFLTEEKLAEQLGHHVRTIARWRLQGIGPRFTHAGRRVIYNRNDIAGWLAAGGTVPQLSKRARAR